MKARGNLLCAWVMALLFAVTTVSGGAAELRAAKPVDLTPSLKEASQFWPAVAAGNGAYLVVWQEGLALAGAKNTSIRAVRVSAAGEPLDRQPITVCDAASFQCYPAVVFDGTNFVVAWQDFRTGRDWDLYAARVTPAGTVLDKDGFAVAAVPGNQIYPALASDGKSALLVWSDLRPQTEFPEAYALYGTFLRDGKPAEKSGHVLVPHVDDTRKSPRSYLTPSVVFDGDEYVLAAQYGPSDWNYGGPLLRRVDRGGQPKPMTGEFWAPSFALASAPASRQTFIFSLKRFEHGSYQVRYLSSLFHPDRAEQTNVFVDGLQGNFAPRNDLHCAATYNGKHFVTVVEQFPHLEERVKNGDKVLAHLVAVRFDPLTGRPLDAKHQDLPSKLGDIKVPSSLRPAPEAGVAVAADNESPARHPAIASAAEGSCLVVYCSHAGARRVKIHGVILQEE